MSSHSHAYTGAHPRAYTTRTYPGVPTRARVHLPAGRPVLLAVGLRSVFFRDVRHVSASWARAGLRAHVRASGLDSQVAGDLLAPLRPSRRSFDSRLGGDLEPRRRGAGRPHPDHASDRGDQDRLGQGGVDLAELGARYRLHGRDRITLYERAQALSIHNPSLAQGNPGRGATPEDDHAKGTEAQRDATEHRATRHRSGSSRSSRSSGVRRADRGHRGPDTASGAAQGDPRVVGSVLSERCAARYGAVARSRRARTTVDPVRRAGQGSDRAQATAEGRRGQDHSELVARRRGLDGSDARVAVLQRHRPARLGDQTARGPRREVHEVETHARHGGGRR
jgi:hypothetical protein